MSLPKAVHSSIRTVVRARPLGFGMSLRGRAVPAASRRLAAGHALPLNLFCLLWFERVKTRESVVCELLGCQDVKQPLVCAGH